MGDADGRGVVLLAIAREAIVRDDEIVIDPRTDWLHRPGASFVTLRLDGELRGCIGTIEPHRALGGDVAHNARGAAYRDPRFTPVASEELARLQLEVSVLSPRAAVRAESESQALAKLRPGIDGVYLEFGPMKATFLPQVWGSLPDPVDFLGELRRKAGLPARFWHAELRLSRYTVEKYR